MEVLGITLNTFSRMGATEIHWEPGDATHYRLVITPLTSFSLAQYEPRALLTQCLARPWTSMEFDPHCPLRSWDLADRLKVNTYTALTMTTTVNAYLLALGNYPNTDYPLREQELRAIVEEWRRMRGRYPEGYQP